MNSVSMKSESLIEIGRKLNIPELKNVSEETDIGKIPLTESLLGKKRRLFSEVH